MAAARSEPVSRLVVHTDLPLPANVRQIDGLQVLRTVAVFLVAWLHAGEYLSPSVKRPLPDLGIFGIDIFFVISGFILSTVVMRSPHARGAGAAWHFLKRRLIRIFPIYWVFAALILGRMLHSHQTPGIVFLFPLLLLPSPDYPGMVVAGVWTLVFEMFFYYLLAAIQLITMRRAVSLLIVLLSGLAGVGLVCSIRRPYLIVIANPILLEFVFGACIALLFRRFGRRRSLGMALAIIGVVGAIVVKRFYDVGATSMQMIFMNDLVWTRVFTFGVAAAALGGGIIFWVPNPKGRAWRAAVVLGNSSYSAYLVSMLAMEATSRALFAFFRPRPPLLNGLHFVYQLLDVIAVFALGWVLYQFIEWPMLRKLQRVLHAER